MGVDVAYEYQTMVRNPVPSAPDLVADASLQKTFQPNQQASDHSMTL